jgi:long-subunit acyl-CoA synthetase (AMP-forming)
LIIYTTGTTGQPKGVVLGASQIDAGIHAMAEAVGARADDRMLAALPPALLLQQMAGMAVPLSVGAAVILCPDPRGFIQIAEATAPTATVLVPDMLAGWVTWLERTGRRAPASLRFVAVGGAPVPSHLAGRAWALGVPVHEGYGLSECCSVVAVNRPGQRRPGTVGRPLSGLRVTIDRGEIVVAGPTVMDGYLGGETSNGIRRTGDAGHFDDGGNLIVEGRIDDVIVTATGRNIHPEWIEAMILTDPGIARCAVVAGGTHPRAVVCQVDWQQPVIAPEDLDDLIAVLCADAPDYARPRGSVAISEADLRRLNLMTASGSLRRRAIGAFLKEMS